jgi:glycerate-2-kinase
MLSLVLSDVVGDDMSAIASGPTVPDPTTFSDAWHVMKKYGITKTKAAQHIARGARGMSEETPKPGDPIFGRVLNVLVGNNALACKAAASYLRRRKVRTEYLGSGFDGQARDFGAFMARLAGDIKSKSPFAFVAGGETTVRLGRKAGTGGRNQEAALVFALENACVTAAFVGTDGIDGNSDAAGALVSGKSAKIARKINANVFLDRHDSYHALKKMNSLVFTGYTDTNVNDIAIVYRSVAHSHVA